MWWYRKQKKERDQGKNIYEAALPEDKEGEIDINSPTWKWIRRWAGEELRRARERNDFPKLDTIKTSSLRGRIRLLKEVINLPAKVDKR